MLLDARTQRVAIDGEFVDRFVVPRGPKSRRPVLLERQRLKMARSAHAYVRGSTAKFYEWLERADSVTIPSGPPIWICGDCHVGNLGPVAHADGRIAIQIRDLDQTVIGNPAHDLIRLGLSLAMAARSARLPGVMTSIMMEQLVAGYEQAFTKRAPKKDEEADALPHPVQLVMKQAARRTWKHLMQERLEDTKPTIPLGKRFWPLQAKEQRAVAALFADTELQAMIVGPGARKDVPRVELIDAAYWMKGCSSLGLLRLVVLVRVTEGGERSLRLIDVKEAAPSFAPRDASCEMPRSNAERIVAGARALSPFLGERMVATRLLDRAVFVRELLPQDLKLELDELTAKEAVHVARFLASVVGRAHARQLDAAARKAWKAELGRRRPKSLEAPSWLWTSVVELVASHEAAYLHHCRKYALEQAREWRGAQSSSAR